MKPSPAAACIDIGTNSILLSIGILSSSAHWIREIYFEQQITCLGENLSADLHLKKEAMERSLTAIVQMVKKAKSHPVGKIILSGTQALRSAENKDEFIKKVKDRTNLEINILSPEEEARLGYLAVEKTFNITGHKLTIDAGGGSTELTLGLKGNVLQSKSLPIGCVILKERFPRIETRKKWLHDYFIQELTGWPLPPKFTLVGLGGTITTLGAIHLGLEKYDSEKIHGHNLEKSWINEFVNAFHWIKKPEWTQFKCASPARLEVLSSGIEIILGLLIFFNKKNICISDAALRHTVLWEALTGKSSLL
jgi:exopolyphosphatase/guanosine-5'-triphosphate,3'-diphosphate pyrophosphatase